MFLIPVTLADMIEMMFMNMSNMEESILPFIILIQSLSFLVAFIFDLKILFIDAFVGFSILSFLYLYNIIMLAISADNTIIDIMNKEPMRASFFSPKVTSSSANIAAARKDIFVFSLAMFSIMSIIATSAGMNILQKKKKTKQMVVTV